MKKNEKLCARRKTSIGGQALMEGIMMRGPKKAAMAVRRPNGQIFFEEEEIQKKKRPAFCRWPIIRGVFGFVDSMVMGYKYLMRSAEISCEEVPEEKPADPGQICEDAEAVKGAENGQEIVQEKAQEPQSMFGKGTMAAIMVIATVLGILLAVGLFVWLPTFLYSLIAGALPESWALGENRYLRSVFEGILKVAILVLYMALVSLMKDIRRTFMYHGAEHKTINCIEKGMAPTVHNVRKCSRLHKRCGTSFLLFVMLISVIFFLVVRVETLWMRFAVRILFVPVIAGISYEFIRLAGSSESKIIGFLSKPGLWLQGLTTREPDDDMIRVAVASVEAVFDWQAYIDENFDRKLRKKNGKVRKVPAGTKTAVSESTKAVPDAESVATEEQESIESVVYETPTVEKKYVKETVPVPVQKAEPEDITAKFDWSFPSAKKEEPDEATAKENRSRLAEKVSAADRSEEAGKAAGKAAPVRRDADDEDEDDEILRALDKFFVFEGEGTVMERSGDK